MTAGTTPETLVQSFKTRDGRPTGSVTHYYTGYETGQEVLDALKARTKSKWGKPQKTGPATPNRGTGKSRKTAWTRQGVLEMIRQARIELGEENLRSTLVTDPRKRDKENPDREIQTIELSLRNAFVAVHRNNLFPSWEVAVNEHYLTDPDKALRDRTYQKHVLGRE
ncbi:hypothetical protein AUJ14_03090 [Candidatus Micrarchaeota archaeon CG1_02_55_22]|nr:MAG: hypothetical protein AUJ14_03090 [Candidatus Micrarchaeota archaeon CG1_02_55_22]